MLFKTDIVINPIEEQEMYEMVEKGLRGGMCQVSSKQAIANNKYMGEDYDDKKPSNYITYLDANNLYGLAMSQKLPTGKLQWTKKTPNVMEWNENDNFRLHTGSRFRVSKRTSRRAFRLSTSTGEHQCFRDLPFRPSKGTLQTLL